MAFSQRYGKFNPKRKLARAIDSVWLDELEKRVGYGGNPEHKRNPGDFDLEPPSDPRPHKTLCDDAGIVRKADALALVKAGIRAGLVSHRCGGNSEWPQNIWSVHESGTPMEAQLENGEKVTYHGYPMPENDPFREYVLAHWSKRMGEPHV